MSNKDCPPPTIPAKIGPSKHRVQGILKNAMKQIAGLALILSALLFLPVTGAHSQTITYQPGPGSMGKKGGGAGQSYHAFKTLDHVLISLGRDTDQWNSNFTLRLTGKQATSACATVGPIDYEMTQSASVLEITIHGYSLQGQRRPKNCTPVTGVPTVNIPLNGAELKYKGVTAIRFDTGLGFETFTLDIEKEYARLHPGKNDTDQTVMEMARVSGVIDPLYRWFYPTNTIVLYAPKASKDTDIQDEIARFAQSHNLKPLSDKLPDFTPPLAGNDYYYYVDKSGKYAKVAPAQIGTITVKEKTYGLHDDVWKDKTLAVYARTPRMYE